MSNGFTEAARTRIRTWPGPGSGGVTSDRRSTSGAPYSEKVIALDIRNSRMEGVRTGAAATPWLGRRRRAPALGAPTAFRASPRAPVRRAEQTGHRVEAVPVVPVVLLVSGEQDRGVLPAVGEYLSAYVEAGGRREGAAFSADAGAAL